MQEAAWATTIYEPNNRQTKIIPTDILNRLREKRKAKTMLQKHKTHENKNYLNKLAKQIKSKMKGYNIITMLRIVDLDSGNYVIAIVDLHLELILAWSYIYFMDDF